MSGTGPARTETAETNLDKARHGIEQAETGDIAGVEWLDEAEQSDPSSVEAAEQEAADGPHGRGLSR